MLCDDRAAFFGPEFSCNVEATVAAAWNRIMISYVSKTFSPFSQTFVFQFNLIKGIGKPMCVWRKGKSCFIYYLCSLILSVFSLRQLGRACRTDFPFSSYIRLRPFSSFYQVVDIIRTTAEQE